MIFSASVINYRTFLFVLGSSVILSKAASLLDHDQWKPCGIPSLRECLCASRESSLTKAADQLPDIVTVNCSGVKNTTTLADVPVSVEEIIFVGNDVRSLSSDFFGSRKLDNLRKLNLSSNNIESVDNQTFENLNNLEVLDMSNNKWEVGNVSSNVFSFILRLKTLTLNSAFTLSTRYVNGTKGRESAYRTHFVDLQLIFNETRLVLLENLHLDNNELMYFSTANMRYMGSLREISLADNLLSKLRLDSSFTPNLCSIRLDNNRFSVLTSELRSDLKRLCKAPEGSSNLTLSLSGNSMKCACDAEPFVSWMKSNDSRFISDRDSLQCMRTERFSQSITVLDLDMLDLDPEPCERSARGPLGHAYGVLVSVIVIIVIVVVFGVLCHVTKQCRARQRLLREPKRQEDVRQQRLESSAHYSKLDV